jgi:hypothetical protein
MKTNKLAFSKNFRPCVTVKKDSVCSLKRHYRGAVREFIGYCDLLASQDPERFIWASVSDIAEHCTDYKNKKPYCLRIVKYCKTSLRAKNIISGQIARVRNGVLRTGFILQAHGEVTERRENKCHFAAQVAPLVAPVVALAVAPVVALAVAPLNAESCTDGCTDGCTSESPQIVTESNTCGQSEKVCQKFGESFASPSLGNRQAYKPISLENPNGNAKAGKKKTSENPDPKSSSPDPDLTVGKQINTSVELEELIDQISDKEFDTEKLEKYDYRNELKTACIEAIEAKASRTLDRKSLRAVMDHAMVSLKKSDINAPGGWLPVMKILKLGGPCRTFSTGKEHHDEFKPPTDLWTDPCSSLRCYETELKPFREILDTAATQMPIPGCWTEAVEFLDAVINSINVEPPEELVKVRDSIREKIPTPVELSSTSVGFRSTLVQ